MVTQQFVITITEDGRFAKRQDLLASQIADRSGRIEGVENADCRAIQIDQVVISRAEYDQLRHKISHLEALHDR